MKKMKQDRDTAAGAQTIDWWDKALKGDTTGHGEAVSSGAARAPASGERDACSVGKLIEFEWVDELLEEIDRELAAGPNHTRPMRMRRAHL